MRAQKSQELQNDYLQSSMVYVSKNKWVEKTLS